MQKGWVIAMNRTQKYMSMNEAPLSHSNKSDSSEHRSYETPRLIVYGDVRDVTLGPTPGIGESGCEFDRRAGSPLECP